LLIIVLDNQIYGEDGLSKMAKESINNSLSQILIHYTIYYQEFFEGEMKELLH